MIPLNPIRDYKKPPEDLDIILPPTREEIRRIQAAAKPHLVRIILLAYYTGLRPGAVGLLSLRWQQVDVEGGYILIISAVKGGQKQRRVKVHPAFAPTARRHLRAAA